jgi:D-tyrosyl-tRNA(Tyr) deacylase
LLALIQRVTEARVVIDGDTAGQIDRGILLLLGVEKHDEIGNIDKMVSKVLSYRIFPDAHGQMNLCLKDVDGGLLVVSQFTLAANTNKGLRPSFSSAAPPDVAERLYDEFVMRARTAHHSVETGRFGSDMKVHLVNDGPVTFLLRV